MKLFAKLMLAVLVIAMLLPFTILKDDSGKTLMSFSDFEWPDFSRSTLPKVPAVDSIRGSSGNNTIYQWFDSEGNIQFTTDPPPQGIDYQVRQFDPDANVIQSISPPSGETPAASGESGTENSSTPVDLEISPFSPDSVKKLIEDARNVEKLLDERFRGQESAINQ